MLVTTDLQLGAINVMKRNMRSSGSGHHSKIPMSLSTNGVKHKSELGATTSSQSIFTVVKATKHS
jgi:hypothetical protein